MIPISLVWIVLIATFKGLRNAGLMSPFVFLGLAAVVALAFLAIWFMGSPEEAPAAVDRDEPFDAFAGGYPVPPQPGQALPEFADMVPGSAEPDPTTEEK